ncbi:MAG: hypothetical protein ACI9OJ_000405 [Myxococcota bacterium]|jgi:hypothetical protein
MTRCRCPSTHSLPRLLMLCFLVSPALAMAETGESTPMPRETGAYVTVNLGVEMHAIDTAAQQVAQSMADLSRSVAKLAESPSLSDAQKEELLAVIGRVDGLSGRVVDAVDRLPAAIEQSRKPLVAIADDLASDVRLTIFMTLGLVILVVIAALAGVYLFVLKPSRSVVTHATARITDLFAALERTADLVAQTNAAQLELAKHLGHTAASDPGATHPVAADAPPDESGRA